MQPFLTRSPSAPPVPIIILEESAFDDWRGAQRDVARRWADVHGFTARKDEVLMIPGHDGNLTAVILGVGPYLPEEGEPWIFAKLAASVPPGLYRIATPLASAVAYHAALGWMLEQYRFDRYKTEASVKPRTLVIPDSVDEADLKRMTTAIFRVRDLVNIPASDLGPVKLAAAAREIADAHGARYSEIIGDELLARNLPAIHAVGRAAAESPRLIDMTWGRSDAPKVTLVGKGVCFDSGGLDLKPSSGMRLMKKDMGGAAHALALAAMIMDAALPVRLRLLIPAVENSVGGNAYRPGDVLQTHKGLTVEVDNTDAEGRLVLADALAVADAEVPDLLIDFATLTGAARVALGADIPPFFTDSESLATALTAQARHEADPVWRLPLWLPYLDDLRSSVADIANSGPGGFAGAITAALFLRKFVTATPNWLHLDVYAWNKTSRPGRPSGGEAMGLRAIYRVIEERFGG